MNKLEEVIFSQEAFTNIYSWMRYNPNYFNKIESLVTDCLRHPFTGLGKPEPLKGEYKGCWSRRINDEHRLIYFITAEGVHIVECSNHYLD